MTLVTTLFRADVDLQHNRMRQPRTRASARLFTHGCHFGLLGEATFFVLITFKKKTILKCLGREPVRQRSPVE